MLVRLPTVSVSPPANDRTLFVKTSSWGTLSVEPDSRLTITLSKLGSEIASIRELVASLYSPP